MNSHQRRIARRAAPAMTGCGRQGFSGTTSYPDLMCVDGYMRDMDADGWDPSVSACPCKICLPRERADWDFEQIEDDDQDWP